MFGVVI